MWKSLQILSFTFIQFNANAQLFTNYSVGISGLVDRGIRTKKIPDYYSTPNVFGGNLLFLTENREKRIFLIAGIGITQYKGRTSFRTHSLQDPMSPRQFLPNSSTTSTATLSTLNIPLSLGYRFLTGKKFTIFASIGADLRFKLDSKLHYVIRDSTENIFLDRTETNSYLKKMYLFNLSVGMEYRSLSGRWIYRIEPFIKVDSRKFFKSDDTLLNEFLSYGGAHISCFYQLHLKNKNNAYQKNSHRHANIYLTYHVG